MDGIAESVNTPCLPTGFDALDRALDGGLYEGLYIVGAISLLGKTTLVTQIGDWDRLRRADVLVFSLEMARAELMAKSISRHIADPRAGAKWGHGLRQDGPRRDGRPPPTRSTASGSARSSATR